jgi:hypothetical protein
MNLLHMAVISDRPIRTQPDSFPFFSRLQLAGLPFTRDPPVVHVVHAENSFSGRPKKKKTKQTN